MKEGLDFFPLDTVLDDKFGLIEAEFGLTGFAVVVKLLQKIYGERGYYCEWTKEVALLFARKIGLGGSVVSEIVSASIKRGIFDKDLYDKYGILTSNGIQKRYFEAVSRRKKVTVDQRYLLGDYGHFSENVNKNEKNVDISLKNADISEQSKGEESKGNITVTNAREARTTKTPQEVLGKAYPYYKRRLDEWCAKKGVHLPESVLVKWYEEDLKTGRSKMRKDGSFDVDEFFTAALKASGRRMK